MKLNDRAIETIAKAAAQAALEYADREKQKQEKLRYDRRLRNIKLLLRNYRSFVKHCAEIKDEMNELDEMIDLGELSTDELKVMAIKKSKAKTLAIVKFINKMLKVYEITCGESGKEDEIRRFQVIYHMYISNERKTADEISAMHNIAVRTVFIDIEKACKDLAVLIFGVDAIRF